MLSVCIYEWFCICIVSKCVERQEIEREEGRQGILHLTKVASPSKRVCQLLAEWNRSTEYNIIVQQILRYHCKKTDGFITLLPFIIVHAV